MWVRQETYEEISNVSPHFLHHYQDNKEAGMSLVEILLVRATQAAERKMKTCPHSLSFDLATLKTLCPYVWLRAHG